MKSDFQSVLPRKPDTKPEPQPEPEKKDTNLIRQSIYFPLGVHEQLREAEFTMRKRRHDIYREALDLWFKDKGLPTWDEATKKGLKLKRDQSW